MGTQQPVHTIREGRVHLAIWPNETQNPKAPKYNITLERRYQPEGGDWKSASNFSSFDLEALAKVIEEAQTFVEGDEASEKTQVAAKPMRARS